jgi:prephenate dehydratase
MRPEAAAARLIAYQGAPGAFGHEACLTFAPGLEPVAFPAFADVVAAVEEGRAAQGMLPVHNNEAGTVEEVERLLAAATLDRIAEFVLPVSMHLLGLPGVALGGIRIAVSHPVALKQCARTLDRLALATEEAANTAVAAASLNDPAKVVLGSETAARLYGLEILLRDVHDRPDNATTFVLVAPSALRS